ncbi:hypothetical protein BDV10DRAFT_165605 [Aspergillus recurvatus]
MPRADVMLLMVVIPLLVVRDAYCLLWISWMSFFWPKLSPHLISRRLVGICHAP